MTAARAASVLSDEDLASLYADIDALPPLTDEQIDALADVLVEIRLRGKGKAEGLALGADTTPDRRVS